MSCNQADKIIFTDLFYWLADSNCLLLDCDSYMNIFHFLAKTSAGSGRIPTWQVHHTTLHLTNSREPAETGKKSLKA